MGRDKDFYVGRLDCSELGMGTTTVTSLLKGSVVWDPGSLIDAAGESKDITVTGAALGDFVLVAPGVDTVDMVVSATVTAADTVTVRLQNESGGTVDLASSTWTALVFTA